MQTKLIRSIYNLSQADQGGVITIGNFDGVHLGHQALLNRVVKEAHKRAVPSLVISFEPHPFEFFSHDQLSIPRLTRLREKFLALRETGVDRVLILPFNQELANLSASDFVKTILYQNLRARHIIIGDDFHFGYKRQGNFALLQSLGQQFNFSVEAMPTLEVEGGRVSSTRVREALARGDHSLVKKLLGHPYSMHGRVSYGNKLGRKLGFPTANIFVHRKLTPVHGVYTVKMHGIGPQPLLGAANVGTRPTVDGTRTLLEVHLLDFDQDIYGKYVEVEFCTKLREEIRYSNLNLLKEQIAQDVMDTRNYFQKNGVT